MSMYPNQVSRPRAVPLSEIPFIQQQKTLLERVIDETEQQRDRVRRYKPRPSVPSVQKGPVPLPRIPFRVIARLARLHPMLRFADLLLLAHDIVSPPIIPPMAPTVGPQMWEITKDCRGFTGSPTPGNWGASCIANTRFDPFPGPSNFMTFAEVQNLPTTPKGYTRYVPTGVVRLVQGYVQPQPDPYIIPGLVRGFLGDTLAWPVTMPRPYPAPQPKPEKPKRPVWVREVEPDPLAEPKPVPSPSPRPGERPRPLPKPEPAPNPHGDPSPKPEGGLSPNPAPKPQTKPEPGKQPPTPPHRFRPPGRGVKEKKLVITPVGIGATAIAGLNEIVEKIDILHDSLPPEYQCKPGKKTGPRKGVTNQVDETNRFGDKKSPKQCSPQEKARTVYRHLDKIDPVELVKNLVLNHVEDKAWGRIGRALGEGGRRIGRPTGLGTGPAL